MAPAGGAAERRPRGCRPTAAPAVGELESDPSLPDSSPLRFSSPTRKSGRVRRRAATAEAAGRRHPAGAPAGRPRTRACATSPPRRFRARRERCPSISRVWPAARQAARSGPARQLKEFGRTEPRSRGGANQATHERARRLTARDRGRREVRKIESYDERTGCRLRFLDAALREASGSLSAAYRGASAGAGALHVLLCRTTRDESHASGSLAKQVLLRDSGSTSRSTPSTRHTRTNVAAPPSRCSRRAGAAPRRPCPATSTPRADWEPAALPRPRGRC